MHSDQAAPPKGCGDADVVFVHDRPGEDTFVAEGVRVRRFDVRYNDFVVVGPKSDAAHIASGNNVVEEFRKVAATKAPFISRGDRSGTSKPNSDTGCGSRGELG